MKFLFSVLLLNSLFFFSAFAQEESVIAPEDTVLEAPIERSELSGNDDRPRNFSLVFNRGLMISSSSPDSVPLNGSASGTYSIGGGIKIPVVKETIRLRLTPSIAWTHYSYDQTNLKTFPTVVDSLPYQLALEKHTLVYGELPVGVIVNILKDDDGDPRFFVEAGGYVGYMLAANYKTRFTNSDGLRIKEKIRDLEGVDNEFERLRYGLYGRLGYKWAALYFAFRLSDVYDEFTNPEFRPVASELYRNPKIPPMEVGLTVFF